MLARILVPLDGSRRAERAIPVAAKVARSTGGAVLLVRVATSPIVYGPAFVPPPLGMQTSDEKRYEVAAYLTQIAGLPALSGITTQTVALTGHPADALLRAIDTLSADIVIMTSHGRTGLMRWALGSVAQHLARHANIPILILRESGPTPLKRGAAAEYPLRVLVPLDGSPAAETALPHALHLISALAAPGQAAIHLTLVISPYEADKNNMPDALAVDGAKSYLAGVAAKLKTQPIEATITWSVAANLDIAAALVRVAENGEDAEGAGIFGGCDLIAMSSIGRSGITRLLMGSIATRVLLTTNRPTLIIPYREQQR
jgi:nucleotide-binding universal stress UspA family protein